MKAILKTLSLIFSIIILSCKSQKEETFTPKVVYESEDLVITQISENAFEHISYLQTQDFGNVPCNGLIVKNNDETIVLDTPTNDKSTEDLIKWIKETLHCRINAIIPTHFHNDCLGGLTAFHAHDIPSYAYFKTVELAKENEFAVPQNSFTDPLTLKVGSENVIVKFFGEGHTRDNVVGYFPAEDVMFGGCLLKENNAGKGYLGDANVAEWSATVEKVKREYPDVKIVVPGHGEYGNKELLDYTINLFKTE